MVICVWSPEVTGLGPRCPRLCPQVSTHQCSVAGVHGMCGSSGTPVMCQGFCWYLSYLIVTIKPPSGYYHPYSVHEEVPEITVCPWWLHT